MSRVSAPRYGRALYWVLASAAKTEVVAILGRFDAFLRRHHDQRKWPAIVKAYEAYADEARGVVTAQVTAARELTPTATKQIKAAVSEMTGATAVELVVTVDPAVIGGVRIQIGDRRLDATISASLRQLANSIIV